MIPLSRSGLILGWATPNWSIRFLNTLYVLSNASYADWRIAEITLSSVSVILMRSGLDAANKAASLPVGFSFLYSSTKRVIKSALLFAFLILAFSRAFKNIGSLELLARALNKPVNSTSSVTLIPP